MPAYTVVSETYLPDLQGRSVLRQVGEVVQLTEQQASYLVLTGQLSLGGTLPPPPDPVALILVADVVRTERGSLELEPTIAQLETFHLRAGGPFANAIAAGGTGSPGTPSGLSPIVAALIFG